MARKNKVTREEVLAAAAEVVRRGGEEALGARAVAEVLGCSTQPVYSLFGSMEELRGALFETAKEGYRHYIEDYLGRGGPSRYAAYGRGFVRFAREEKGLFRFLFLRGGQLRDPFYEDILAEMQTLYRMPRETAEAFHADMSIFSLGLAVLVYRGADVSEEEVASAFNREFYALYALYFPGRPHFWEGSEHS